MTFLKQISLLVLAACLGLALVGCQPSDPDAPKVADVTSITITPNPVGMEIGGVQALTVTGTFSNNKTSVVNFTTTFASSAPDIARVDAGTGYVTALAAGSATITATHQSGNTATTVVTVSPLRVLSIAVSPATSTLALGATQALTVTATYNNATTGPVTNGSTFVSSDPAVATVDAAGVVTAVALGTATITATHTASGKTGTAAITVAVGGGGGGFSNIGFDTPGVTYTLTGFGGAEDSTLVPDPSDASNTVAKVVKSATAETYAGTTVSTGADFSVERILFTATSTRMTVRVYSPKAGIPVRLKVEDAADDTRTVETEAVTTQVNTWETLTFDFANQAAGTAALNLAYTYNKISIFFDFGTSGADGGDGTFYFDDVTFVADGSSGNTGTCSAPCIDFSSASVKYEPFEGLVLAEQSDDPLDATNKVAKFVKGPSGQPWAGATIYTVDADKSVPEFDLSSSKIVTLRVYAPAAGITVRLKLEDAANNAIFLEQDVLTSKANEWETLSFDFATPVNGVYDAANTYNKVSLFPAFSTTAPPPADLTFYFDELQYTTTSGGGGGSAPTDAPTTVIPAGSVTIYSDAASVTGLDPFPDWGQNPPVTRSEVTIAGNKSLQYIWPGPTGLYQGIDWASNPVDVSAKGKLHIDFWSPDVTSVKVSIIGGGKENAYTQALTTGGWNSVDIDLSNYTEPDKAAIIQIKLEPSTAGTLYVDNIYFWGTAGGGGGTGVLVTFDEAPPPNLTAFGVNGAPPVVDLDPAGGTNKVLKVFKYALPAPGSEQWAGVTVSTGANDSIPAIPFTATAKTMTVRVYSPAIGVRVRLKVENASNPAISCETDAITTQAGAWETLTFNFANPGLSPPVGGGATAPLDLAQTYNKISIFSDFGIGNGGSAPLPADRVYYYDDITF